MSDRKGKKKSPDKDTETPVVGVIAACGCTVQKVYCRTHGPQTVAKKYERKKGTKKLKQKNNNADSSTGIRRHRRLCAMPIS